MTPVRLDHVTKHFGETVALDDTSFEINAGELFFLLGPSGCGKSTLLRLIAGLHEPTSGRLYFGDRDVTDLGTEKRNAVMCFQSYALWPHMTVCDNVKFGLDVKGTRGGERDAKIKQVLELVRMAEYADRKPNQLSGGQQQRVALARAIAVEPDVLLLDEPLSNLDAKLRHEMRSEIRRICKESGLTAVYVTHDQKEALSVADRIAVLKDGRVQQIGSPGDLYHKPGTAFVADFVGQTNLIAGEIVGRENGAIAVDTQLGRILSHVSEGQPSGRVMLSIRPEQMQLVGPTTDGRPARANRVSGTVRETTFLGEASEHVIDVGGASLKAIAAPPRFDVHAGDALALTFDADDVVVLPAG